MNPEEMQEDNKNSLLRNFMPFGGGIRLCVGAEFSKVLIALFFHTLVTNYRYIYFLGVQPPVLHHTIICMCPKDRFGFF